MNKEQWENIRGYRGNYQVSTFGSVRSIARIENCDGRYFRKRNGRILKPIQGGSGYLQVNLCLNGKHRIVTIHRLVIKHFLKNPKNKPQTNHKDGNKHNNHISNLEWSNASENGLHSYRELGNVAWQKGRQGENMPTSKPVLQETLDGKLVKRWGCGLDAVRDGGFESSCISRCVQGIYKTHKGYIWEYAK